MPRTNGTLDFEPGVVLRCLQRGRWLVIDELNRADIDKAFGPLFDAPRRNWRAAAESALCVAFPNVEWQECRGPSGPKAHWRARRSTVLTPGWRLIGTLNLSDKATLFQLSFAFLRRFAVVDVPLPGRLEYEAFFDGLCGELSEAVRPTVVSCWGMSLAFGPRQLGPAILRDIALFLEKGLAETASGTATYDDEVVAFATAVRLFAVPQYEGAAGTEVAFVHPNPRGRMA